MFTDSTIRMCSTSPGVGDHIPLDNDTLIGELQALVLELLIFFDHILATVTATMACTLSLRPAGLTNDYDTRAGTKLLNGFADGNTSDSPAYFRAPPRTLPLL